MTPDRRATELAVVDKAVGWLPACDPSLLLGLDVVVANPSMLVLTGLQAMERLRQK